MVVVRRCMTIISVQRNHPRFLARNNRIVSEGLFGVKSSYI